MQFASNNFDQINSINSNNNNDNNKRLLAHTLFLRHEMGLGQSQSFPDGWLLQEVKKNVWC